MGLLGNSGIRSINRYLPESGLTVHLDGTNASTITIAGGKVTRWADISGNGNDFVTGYSGSSWNPTRDATLFENRGGVKFVATQWLSSEAALSTVNKNAYSVLFVLKKTSMSGWFLLHDHTNTRYLMGNGPGNRLGSGGASSFRSASGMAINTTLVYGLTNNNGTVKYLVNDTFYPAFTAMGNGHSGAGTLGIVNIGYGDTINSYDMHCGEVVIYNRVLSDSEMLSASRYLQRKFNIRNQGIATANIIYDGNSIVNGTSSSTSTFPSLATTNAGLTEYDYKNFGVGGQITNTMVSVGASRIDTQYNSSLSADRNIVVMFEITNSLEAGASAATIQSQIQSYCQARRTAGWKVMVLTCLPRTTNVANFETNRQTINQWIRDNYTNWADYLADVGADATIGVADANLNNTYYGDGIHPSDTAHSIIAGYVTAGINEIIQ